jgi:hypothetical protein
MTTVSGKPADGNGMRLTNICKLERMFLIHHSVTAHMDDPLDENWMVSRKIILRPGGSTELPLHWQSVMVYTNDCFYNLKTPTGGGTDKWLSS